MEECESLNCFAQPIEIKKPSCSSLSLSTQLTTPKIMIYIKPWDSTVFENFFVFLKTVQSLEEEF